MVNDKRQITDSIKRELECQLATSHLGRYLAGEELSPLVLRDLERHIASCSECQRAVAQRKASIQSLLEQEIDGSPEHSAAHPFLEGIKSTALGASGKTVLLGFLSKKQSALFGQPAQPQVPSPPVQPQPPQNTPPVVKPSIPIVPSPWIKNWKPITVAASLALVMIIVGKVASDPTAFLGKKVSDGFKKPPVKQQGQLTHETVGTHAKDSFVAAYDDPDFIDEKSVTLASVDPAPLKYESRNSTSEYAMNYIRQEMDEKGGPVQERVEPKEPAQAVDQAQVTQESVIDEVEPVYQERVQRPAKRNPEQAFKKRPAKRRISAVKTKVESKQTAREDDIVKIYGPND